MQLFSLDKKLLRLQHRLTKQQVNEISLQHKLNAEQIEKEIRHELYSKFMAGVAKNIPTIAQTDNEYLTYTISGYVLNERDMLNVIKECLDMDDRGKEILLEQINKQLF